MSCQRRNTLQSQDSWQIFIQNLFTRVVFCSTQLVSLLTYHNTYISNLTDDCRSEDVSGQPHLGDHTKSLPSRWPTAILFGFGERAIWIESAAGQYDAHRRAPDTNRLVAGAAR